MISFKVDGHVGTATIERPEKRNALNAQICQEMGDFLEQNSELRAVVLQGEGKAFSAGADLGSRFEPGDGETPKDAFRPALEVLQQQIDEFSGTVIVPIQGPAIGAGMQLAVGCDIRIAGPKAVISIPAAKLSIHLAPSNIERLVQLVGVGQAKEVLLAARTYNAEEALSAGLVSRIVDDPKAAALELAKEISQLAPLSGQGHKRSINMLAQRLMRPEIREQIAEFEKTAFASDDLQEGVASFNEKRPAEFQGK